MNVSASLLVTTMDHPNSTLIAVLSLVVIATVVAPSPVGDLLPESTYLLRLVDITSNGSTIEEEGSMDVVATTLSLLDPTDVACLVSEYRVTLT